MAQQGRYTPISQPPQQIEISKQEPIRELNIGTKFLEALKQKEAVIPMDRHIESQGITAIKRTNETLDHNLVEKLHSQKETPNGYLIGIGAANVIKMLELFPEGQIPKAIILFDIDQEVVSEGKRLIERFKNEPDEEYSVSWTIKDNDHGLLSMHELLQYARSNPEKFSWTKLDAILKKLAKEGNLVIERADFTDQRVTEALNGLPNIHDNNNVIYLSNISDHIWRGKQHSIPDFNYLHKLMPQPPHKNYFVDTTQQSLEYNLRIGTRVPQFDNEDFKLRGTGHQSPIKPLDQIE